MQPSSASAGVGDMYFCETKKAIEFTEKWEKKLPDYKFMFKRTRETLFFLNRTGPYKGLKLTLEKLVRGENFTASSSFMTFHHADTGDFSYALIGTGIVNGRVGKCSTFKSLP